MKKIAILIIVIGLITGCQTLKNVVCSPGATLMLQAAEYAAQIAALQTVYPVGTTIGAALSAALPQIDQLKQGYCVSDQANFVLYVKGLIEGADQTAMLSLKRGPDGKTYQGLKALGLKK